MMGTNYEALQLLRSFKIAGEVIRKWKMETCQYLEHIVYETMNTEAQICPAEGLIQSGANLEAF